MVTAHTENVLGFLAVLVYSATLLPSSLKVLFPTLKMNAFVQMLLRNQRTIGIWTFILSMAHICAVVSLHRMNLLRPEFYWQSSSGLLIITIFTLLTVTSNNWSIKRLKRNWKRLHSLTYVAALIMPWHIAAKMAGQWTWLTPITVSLPMAAICFYCIRRYIKADST